MSKSDFEILIRDFSFTYLKRSAFFFVSLFLIIFLPLFILGEGKGIFLISVMFAAIPFLILLLNFVFVRICLKKLSRTGIPVGEKFDSSSGQIGIAEIDNLFRSYVTYKSVNEDWIEWVAIVPLTFRIGSGEIIRLKLNTVTGQGELFVREIVNFYLIKWGASKVQKERILNALKPQVSRVIKSSS